MVDNENNDEYYSQSVPNEYINDKGNREINQQEEWVSVIEGLRKNKRAKSVPDLQMELTINSQNQKRAKSAPQKNNKLNQLGGSWQ